MAYRLQFRRDTFGEWERVNPVLADAEVGFIKQRGSSLYKIGEAWTQEELDEMATRGITLDPLYHVAGGMKRWNDLPTFGFNGNISQTLVSGADGDDVTSVLNKKVVIEEIARIWEALGVNEDDDETFEQKTNKALEDHKKILDTLQEFADEYGPVVDELVENVDKHEKALYDWEEEVDSDETDPETGEPIKKTITHKGLITQFEEYKAGMKEMHQIMPEKGYMDANNNHIVGFDEITDFSQYKEGTLFFNYETPKVEEEE